MGSDPARANAGARSLSLTGDSAREGAGRRRRRPGAVLELGPAAGCGLLLAAGCGCGQGQRRLLVAALTAWPLADWLIWPALAAPAAARLRLAAWVSASAASAGSTAAVLARPVAARGVVGGAARRPAVLRGCSGGGWLPFTYSGGMPCVTPGTPSGNSALRSPGSFFFSLRPNTSSLSASKFSQPASTGASRDQHRPATRCDACGASNWSSALAVGGDQRRQHFDARAGARRRFAVGRDHVDIAARGGDSRGCARPTAPAIRARCGGRCGPARRAARAGGCISASGAVSTSSMPARTAARSCKVAPSEASAARCVIGLDRVGRLDLREFGGGAQARQHAIAGRRLGRDLGEGGLRLGVLALPRSRSARPRSAAPASAAFLASQYS